MKMKIFFSLSLFFIVTLFSTSHALAHKIRIFAYEDGGQIVAEAQFNKGRPAINSVIRVEDANGEVLLQGRTDENGTFRFAIPEKARQQGLDLNIIVDVGEGHRGSWLLSAADYLDEPAPAADPARQSSEVQVSDKNSGTTQHEHNSSAECTQIAAVVEEVVERELAPIKRLLLENQEKKIDLPSILGGLGYIFGLAGVALYFKGKNNGEKS